MTTHVYRTDSINYLRKKYSVPDDREIIVKQGYITKERTTPTSLQCETTQKTRNMASEATENMHSQIAETREEITALLKALETNEDLQVLGNDWLHEQINAMINGMFAKLTDSTRALIQDIYEEVYAQTSAALGDTEVRLLRRPSINISALGSSLLRWRTRKDDCSITYTMFSTHPKRTKKSKKA